MGVSVGVEAGTSVVADDPGAGLSVVDGSVFEGQFVIDASVGKKAVRGHLGLQLSPGFNDAIVSVGHTSSGVAIGGGLGYAQTFLEGWLEVEGSLGLSVRVEYLAGAFGGANSNTGTLSVHAEPSVTARYFVSQPVALWGTLQYRAALEKWPQPPFTVQIHDNSGLKLQVGIGFHFL